MERFFYQLWYKKRYAFCAYLLLPISAIYYIFWKVKDFLYRSFKLGYSLDCPVISVGNVTLGGTGKTPFIIYLVELLLKKQKKILVLSRGYGGKFTGIVEDKDGFSDEVRLLKRRFPEITVMAGKDRLKNYKNYVSNIHIPDIVILDDGFQHRKINRDFDIIMFDGNLLAGNGMLFPAGPLREPISSVNKMSDLVVVKDSDSVTLLKLRNLFPSKKILNFTAKHFEIIDLSGKTFDKKDLKDKKITAFCGIGNPDSFKRSLSKISIRTDNFIPFDDHINYTTLEIGIILAKASDYYITTEKDAVKLTNLWDNKNNLLILLPKYQLEEDLMDILIL